MDFVKGVIFDLDGTLVDSGRGRARAWSRAFRQWGVPVKEEYLRSLIGLHPEQIVRKILSGSHYHYSKIYQIIQAHNQIFIESEANSVRPCAGARLLVAKLALAGMPLDIASGAPKEQVQCLTAAAGVEAYFKNYVEHPTEVISSNTENVELAAHRIGLLPAECAYIVSSPYGVEAANRLKMKCIALRSGGWQNQALRDAGSIYDDLEDLWFRFNTSCLRETFRVRVARQSQPLTSSMKMNSRPNLSYSGS